MAIKVGGTTVVDDTRQLSNIASVDAATVTALSDAGVGGGGGSFDMTATGAITAGDVVALNSDGTVSTVANVAGDPATLLDSGTVLTLVQENRESASAADDVRQRVVRVYADENNNGYATAICGQIDGTGNITWGLPLVFLSQNLDCAIAVTYNETDTYYYAVCKRPSDGDPLISVIANTGGTTLALASSAANPGGYGDADNDSFSAVYYPPEGQAILVWYSSEFGAAIAASYKFGGVQAHTSFASNNWTEYSDITYDSVNQSVVHIEQSAQNTQPRARVITATSSSISIGSNQGFGTGGVRPRCTFDPDSGKVVYTTVRASQGGVVYYALGTVSGTTTSWATGSSTAVNAADGVGMHDLTYDTGANQVVFSYKADGNPQRVELALGTVSGSTLTFSSNFVEIYSGYSQYTRIQYLPTSGISVWTGSTNSRNLAYATATVVASTNPDWFGVADASISSGSAGKITHIGGINESVSGLTAGTTYYADKVGGLSTTDSGFKVGKAIAADKILITEGNA